MLENELSTYLKNTEIILQTVQQTQKDFGMLSLEILFSGNPQSAYEELSEQVKSIVNRLLSTNYQQLLNLLYRIDISEKKIAETIKNAQNNSLAETISILILNRELQKVIIRNTYSLK